MIGRAARWVDNRLGLSSAARTTMSKVFPDHWTFMMGEIALYSFMVLVLTGVYLTLFFEADESMRQYTGSYAPLHGAEVSAAYASTVELSWDVRAGLLVRQTHHWAALVFLAAIVLHLCRIFFTAAFRRPREVNWLVGVTLLILGMLNGFAGYSLPDDLLSATGLRIANAVLLSIPVVGTWLSFLLFGAEFPGTSVIPRLYSIHILLVPAAITGLITVHMAILIRQKHTHFPGPGRRDTNVVGSTMWPTYAFRSISLLFAVLGVCFALGGLFQINPIWLWGPFSPGAVTSPAQPDWYVGWVDGALRLYPPVNFHVFGHLVPALFVPGVVVPALTFLGLYAWPWIDRLLTGDRGTHSVLDRPRDHPRRVAVGAWALTFYGLLLGAAADDILARFLQVPVITILWIFRIGLIVVPLVVGAIAALLARALRDSGEEHVAGLSGREVRAALPRRKRTGEARRPVRVRPVAHPDTGPQPHISAGDAPVVPVGHAPGSETA